MGLQHVMAVIFFIVGAGLWMAFRSPKAGLIALLVISIFEAPIGGIAGRMSSGAASALGLADDVLLLVVVFVCAVRGGFRRVPRWFSVAFSIWALGLLCATFFSGISGNLWAGMWYQSSWWVALSLAWIFPWDSRVTISVLRTLRWATLLVATVLVVELVQPAGVYSFFGTESIRYEFRNQSLQGPFAGPGALSDFSTLVFAVGIAVAVYGKRGGKSLFLVGAVGALLSLRGRALAAIAISASLSLLATRRVRGFVWSAALALPLALGYFVARLGYLTVVGVQWGTYVSPDATAATARARMWADAWNLFFEFFPFGTGSGTFGTYAASTAYSPLYVKLGYEPIYGLSRQNGGALTDSSFVPWVAEVGAVGLIVVGFVLLRVLSLIVRCRRAGGFAGMAATVLSVLAINGVGSPVWTSIYGPVVLAFSLSFIVFSDARVPLTVNRT